MEAIQCLRRFPSLRQVGPQRHRNFVASPFSAEIRTFSDDNIATAMPVEEKMLLAALCLSLVAPGASLEELTGVDGNQINDPSTSRMVSSSDLVFSMIPDHFITGSGVEVVMRYDFDEDPSSNNSVNQWNGGYDLYLKTAYDYTRWDGPLGMLYFPFPVRFFSLMMML